MSSRFSRLLSGNILGVVDAYGAVHSIFTGDEVEHHSTHFPQKTHCMWRWNHRHSINWLVASQKPTPEEYEAIQRHLTKRYGLKWWDNGHHDIDDLIAKADKEHVT